MPNACILFILTLLVNLCIGIPHPIQEADNNTRCTFPQLPTGYLQIGKTVSVPGQCMQITCQEDLTITGLTCPTFFSTPGCHSSEINLYKEYPDCCPQVECHFGPYNTMIRKRHTADSSSVGSLPHKSEILLFLMLIIRSVPYTASLFNG